MNVNEVLLALMPCVTMVALAALGFTVRASTRAGALETRVNMLEANRSEDGKKLDNLMSLVQEVRDEVIRLGERQALMAEQS